MNREEILNVIIGLSRSQGFYGRLYRDICENEAILDEMVAQNFATPLDMVLWLEC